MLSIIIEFFFLLSLKESILKESIMNLGSMIKESII